MDAAEPRYWRPRKYYWSPHADWNDYEVPDNLSLGLTYLRGQDFVAGGTDEIGHAPVIGI